MTVAQTAPVRRGPLSARHRALGASAEWPASYGDLTRERRAVREAVGMRDVGPLDKLSLAGGTLAPVPPGPAFEVGRVTTGQVEGSAAQLWGLTDDSSLLMLASAERRTTAAAVAALEAAGILVTDVSSLYAALELTGPAARAVLEELFAEDLADGAVADGAVVFGPLANVRATLARIDHADLPSFTALVERDQAEYLWDAFLTVGAPHGLIPVGAAALAED